MSSPLLPSLSSLQREPRPRGFVTARSVLVDLESRHSRSPDVIAPPETRKRGRPKKAVSADDAPAKTRIRKKTTATDDCPDPGDVDQASTKPKARQKRAATTDEQEGATNAAPATKRGRPKKAVAVQDAATATIDPAEVTQPVVKRRRKKIIESADTLDNDVAAEKLKPPPRPRKTKATTKSKSIANGPTAALEAPAADNTEALDSDLQPVAQVEAPIEALDLDPAPKRRRDWTPPTESTLPPSFQQSSDTSPNPEAAATHDPVDDDHIGDAPAALSFTKLIGDFGYQENNSKPPPSLSRTPSDGPTTKRKRLDPIDVAAPEEPKKRKRKAAEPKEPKEPKPRPPKKPKAPKKKPLTITALATAAYLPQPAANEGDQTKLISDFFPQPQSDTAALPTLEADVVKPTESTKRRAPEDKPAPKRKRATKKVHITVPEVHIKLDSPEAARDNARRQQWLFGSSSQLAAAESPTELRDLQQALKESEDMISSQHFDVARATSYAHVPSAPHGTSLSVGQAGRALWMSAARDFEDSTFASDESRDREVEASDDMPQPQYPLKLTTSAPSSHFSEPHIEVLTISSSAPKELESPDSGYVDVDQICGNSSSTTRVSERSAPSDVPHAGLKTGEATSVARKPHEVISLDTTPESEVVHRRALGARDPNTNITRRTVDPESEKYTISPRKTNSRPRVVYVDSPERSASQKATGSAAQISPVVIRRTVKGSHALSAREDARKKYLASSTTQISIRPSQERLHDVPPSPTLISSSKPRGRPPKFGPVPNPASPTRPRGRPRKSISPDGLPISSQLCKLPSLPATSQRAAIAEPSSDYLDIDAISDIEIPSHAPSPPRRLPTSPPKATLDFDKPPPPPLPAIAASTARNSAKQILAEWSTIATILFPTITRTVRSTPPSRDHKAPTWHEKMLLYDPIVLEDLTLWLNSQGVRIEVLVPRIVKGKGKKKADDVETVGETTEIVQEELQPWMVQKWCEEHSICCLWKEGLRGGVRQKY